MKKLIKTIIADDHPIIFAGIKAMIEGETNIKICDCVENIASLKEAILHDLPDLLIFDVNFEGKNMLFELSNLKEICPKMKVIVFSSYDNDSILREAKSYGVEGFLLKNTSKTEFLTAIDSVMNGNTFFSNKVKKFTNAELVHNVPDSFKDKEKLSKREKEIIKFIIQGFDNEAIAKEIFLSLHTVRTHRKNIFNKLNIHSAAELTKLVYTKNLLEE